MEAQCTAACLQLYHREENLNFKLKNRCYEESPGKCVVDRLTMQSSTWQLKFYHTPI